MPRAASGKSFCGGSLEELFSLRAADAAPSLSVQEKDGAVRCLACGHRCLIRPDRRGICKVRHNEAGTLRAPFGYVAGLQADPVEKKPFFHVLPGSIALSFGMLGCDLHCGYCQNWMSSQALREEDAGTEVRPMSAVEITSAAVMSGARLVVSTYNEPLITAEWAAAVFAEARDRGLLCGFVSNGHATPEVLEYLRPVLDLCKMDLKSFDDRQYRRLGGRLAPVLDTLERLAGMGVWVEVVTLLVPGFNDGEEELKAMAGFLAGLSPDIPWHVTAFYPQFRMTEPRPTTAADLLRACDIGRAAGLRHVYAGNLPGRVGGRENTLCGACGALLVERRGFHVMQQRVNGGMCPDCGAAVPGRWTSRQA